MIQDILTHARNLSDPDLLVQVRLLAHQERQATAVLIAHLAILDERRLYLDEGFSSLFAYCTEALHLSEHAAYGRIEAARAARRFPIILEMLAEGALTLTTVALLAPRLTAENCCELVNAAKHRSKRHVEEFLAHLHPLEAVPSVIRRVPLPKLPAPEAASTGLGARSAEGAGATIESLAHPVAASPPALPAPTSPAMIAPLGQQRYRVQFTMSAQTRDKLRLAQDLLSHQIPEGDLGEIFDRALTALIEHLARQKFAATERPRDRVAPRDGRPPSNSRHIPARVKRAVWLRDGGRCAFVARSGRRCGERRFLEFHHVEPYGAGGEASVDNIELRCRAHNVHEASLYFGDAGGLNRATNSTSDAPTLSGNVTASSTRADPG